MPAPAVVASTLDREFLAIRSRLIDLAAAMDRIERSDPSPADDPRWQQIRRSLDVLLGSDASRAERVLLEFSLPYDENWGESSRLDGTTSGGTPRT